MSDAATLTTVTFVGTSKRGSRTPQAIPPNTRLEPLSSRCAASSSTSMEQHGGARPSGVESAWRLGQGRAEWCSVSNAFACARAQLQCARADGAKGRAEVAEAAHCCFTSQWPWLHVTCGRRSRPCRCGLAMLFALRRRHIADRGGLRTHRKNTNRVHWSGNAPPLSTSIRCNAVAAHPQEHGSSGRESSRKYAALPVNRNQPDSATTEARRGSAKTACATHLGAQAHLAAAGKKTLGLR